MSETELGTPEQKGTIPEQEAPEPTRRRSGRVGKQEAGENIKKKKATRKRKKKLEEPVVVDASVAETVAKQAVAVMVEMPCQVLANRYDNIAKQYLKQPDFTMAIGDVERGGWEESIKAIIQTMNAEHFSKWFPWVSLAVCACGTAIPRYKIASQINKVMEKAEAKKQNESESN